MKVLFLDNDGVICLSNNWGGRKKKWAKYRSANLESSSNIKEAPVECRFDDFDKKAIKASQIFLACLSGKSANKQGYIQRELRIALDTLGEEGANLRSNVCI